MKIIYLSQFYYPEPHSIHKEMADTLIALGHEVIVVAPYPSYPLGKIYKGWKQKLFGEWEIIDKVKVLRCWVWPNHSKSMLLRGLHFLSFTLSSFFSILFRIPLGDIFIVHHPPPVLAFIAWFFNRQGRRPFVIRIADLWPEFITQAGVTNNKIILQCIESLMQWIYKKAAHIVVASPGFKRRLIKKKVSSSKISFLHYYADESVYFPQKKNKELLKKLKISSQDKVILYAGNIGKPQRLDIALEAMKLLQDSSPVKLYIIGDGLYKNELMQKWKKENIFSVKFLERVSTKEINNYYSIADALLIQLEDDTIWNDTIPSKIYAYMLSGRPIIAALKGDGAELIIHSRGGVICAPGNARELSRTIEKFFKIPAKKREVMGFLNRDYLLKKYNKNMIMDKFESILLDVLRNAKK